MSAFKDIFNQSMAQADMELDEAETCCHEKALTFIDQLKKKQSLEHREAHTLFTTLALNITEGLSVLGPYEVFERREFDATSCNLYKRNLEIRTICPEDDFSETELVATISLISDSAQKGKKFVVEYRTENPQSFSSSIAQNNFAQRIQARRTDILEKGKPTCLHIFHSEYGFDEADKALRNIATFISITIKGKERDIAKKVVTCSLKNCG